MNFPILSSITFLPLIGAFFIFLTRSEKNQSDKNSIYLSLFTSFTNFFLVLFLWYSFDPTTYDFQFVEETTWISGFIKFKFGIDGISILFILLTAFITPICIISCINSIKSRLKEFLIAILVLETFMIGVFCSLDLVIFYLFFEAGLIPMFLIIGIWGGARKVYSAFKFFLFTLLGSVLMLVAIIAIYWITGTTDVVDIYEIKIPKEFQYLLWLAFFSSFAVKLPMWPVHTWLPDAHVEAPTAGSVILAAILLKMGGYGFLRFSLGMFPLASEYFVPLIFALSVIAIIYTSLVALMQDDMKKLIAYSSVAHMGFVTMGIFTFNKQGIEGSMIQMLSHGLISAALFLCVGVLYDRTHSRLIKSYGGLVHILPKYSFVFMIFALGTLGLPGTSGFVGEFLVLVGTFKVNFLVAIIGSLGVILSAAYMLWLYKRVIFGKLEKVELKKIKDINLSESGILFVLAALVIFFGFYPDPFLETMRVSVDNLINNYNLEINRSIALK
ncbi:MAG: NADH-quinone oxidoreductase subunit M [Pelagibacteraceae bacterium]|jgi:NADH-quinone oxidoreductase subunit M|nr:NADH-quinone oxidoreductase subunit M [Pelagibacteraceae bacterium]MBO6480414.1 NADH-quinone oxidoreductase subunit M [Pelagibacteraceae bacterium]MBO6481133.1 NADH-quinone oxidoreductase subunit M [Pelagibacteraceae bacterium]MBO6483571.1 NADH-quinone oxidoreductase subunit M [Pelagibacteraceae bacterium]MBO6484243.1 NADH-quinone oxidoreductase subunit M [Pelagibacteraceae bacterium]